MRLLGRTRGEGTAEYWSGSGITGEVPVTRMESNLCETDSLKLQTSLLTADV